MVTIYCIRLYYPIYIWTENLLSLSWAHHRFKNHIDSIRLLHGPFDSVILFPFSMQFLFFFLKKNKSRSNYIYVNSSLYIYIYVYATCNLYDIHSQTKPFNRSLNSYIIQQVVFNLLNISTHIYIYIIIYYII